MYRILKCLKDTYITNKVIKNSRSLDSNVGSAGTLDLFKLYNESNFLSGTSDLTELSRILIKFDLEPLHQLTSSIFNPSGSNFKTYINLKNIYGGQTTPTHFNLKVYPLAKDFNEGTGLDVVAYRDLDAANWITASHTSGIIVPWISGGASCSGSIGSNVDYYTSGNIGLGSQSLGVTSFFESGDEDLFIDVTSLVSASIFSNITNNGFRISFAESEENDEYTRFVKRFGSRHTNNKNLHPKLIVKWDGDTISDDSSLALFDQPNKFYIYNTPRSILTNFNSSSQEVTGANSLVFELFASKSISILTTSYSPTHLQNITYKTSILSHYSASFSGSQLSFGSLKQNGIYYTDVELLTTNPTLLDFIDDVGYSVTFQTVWKSLDNSIVYSSGSNIKFNKYSASDSSFDLKNYVVNIINLKEYYNTKEHSKLRVFIQDYNFEVFALKLPRPSKSRIFENMFWRLIDPYTKDIIIPFDDIGTKMSSDGEGMYFDFWFEDLDINKVYEFEFKIIEDDNVHFVSNEGFIFKATK